ncbi:MAG: NAD(P)/FAD-dependent oxidoreductase [Victivallales bacterium]|nr:NAD(P)/FAD-dependent oxidoreductase [Victivallales bacterium]
MSSRTAIVIGAGLSALSAAIRLSHYGWHVKVFERHVVPGGLNSYYFRNGREYDVGLHAMTNIGRAGERSAPLNILLRQLRISRDAFELREPRQCDISFPDVTLHFCNDISMLLESIDEQFPADAENFRAFVRRIREMNPFVTDRGLMPTRSVLAESFSEPLLREMLCCPVMGYGNPMSHEMDFRQFCIIFRGLFLEGMGRPAKGMKAVLDCLVERMDENGAQLELGCGIRSICHDGKRVTGVVDDSGKTHDADMYLTCIGLPETACLLSSPVEGMSNENLGKMAYAEVLFELNCQPAQIGMKESIVFWNGRDTFDYYPSEQAFTEDSRIICVPENFDGIKSKEVRVTLKASPTYWYTCASDDYHSSKKAAISSAKAFMEQKYPGFSNAVVREEMYTPRTFTRFTSRLNGAIYGIENKQWDGRSPLENLRLIGTDQGYLGIVGALMSGVSMANAVLAAN